MNEEELIRSFGIAMYGAGLIWDDDARNNDVDDFAAWAMRLDEAGDTVSEHEYENILMPLRRAILKVLYFRYPRSMEWGFSAELDTPLRFEFDSNSDDN
jgi:hypothetical protein